MNAVVDLETAKKLTEAGYHGEWPQMVHILSNGVLMPLRYSQVDDEVLRHFKWYAAPSHLQATEWFAAKYGWAICCLVTAPAAPGDYWASGQDGLEVVPDEPSPDALLLLLLKRELYEAAETQKDTEC
mgnify:CR=1 FL=1